MYVRTDIIDGCAVSKLVQLGPGETPPSWGGEAPRLVVRSFNRFQSIGACAEDPRDEIQGGQWKGVLGGVHFRGERLQNAERLGYPGTVGDLHGSLPQLHPLYVCVFVRVRVHACVCVCVCGEPSNILEPRDRNIDNSAFAAGQYGCLMLPCPAKLCIGEGSQT